MAHFQTHQQWGAQEPNEKMSCPYIIHPWWWVCGCWFALAIFLLYTTSKYFCFKCGLQFEMFQYGIQHVHPILTTLIINCYLETFIDIQFKLVFTYEILLHCNS